MDLTCGTSTSLTIDSSKFDKLGENVPSAGTKVSSAVSSHAMMVGR
jgi:hypothetical protein